MPQTPHPWRQRVLQLAGPNLVIEKAQPIRWPTLLQALRKAGGFTQSGWAAWLGFSRTTVQRWESGEAVPGEDAEPQLISFCREKGLFRTYSHGPLRGLTLTPESLHDALTEGRLNDSSARRLAIGRAAWAGTPENGYSSASVARHNLPVQATELIGREAVIAGIKQRLAEPAVRLLTLTGPGGTGKTRLAVQVANDVLEHFREVFFVDLASVRDPDQTVPALGRTLGVREAGGQPMLESLKTFISDKSVLLVLDNFEHILSAAVHVAQLLGACSELKILATSAVSGKD